MDEMFGESTGDRCGFDELYAGHVVRLARLAALLGAEEPEDVAQEAFCRFYAASRRARPDDVVAYLNRIVVNEVRSRGRRRRTAAQRAHLVTVLEPAADSTAERRAVVEELRRLPHRQREALVLRYWLDLTHEQVADAMGTRVGTAKSQVSRGLHALGEALGEEMR